VPKWREKWKQLSDRQLFQLILKNLAIFPELNPIIEKNPEKILRHLMAGLSASWVPKTAS
jgi:hypothetical protein